MKSILVLALFLVACFAAAATGAAFGPDAWYAALQKPGFNPPNWVFAPVWTTLYAMIAVSGWLVWRARGFTADTAIPFLAYALQLVLNALWTVLFFGMHRPDLAFYDIVALWLAIVATIALFAPLSRAAAWLLVPYLAWVSFAAFLNHAIWRLNP